MRHHNLQINHIIHYCEANDTSQPTNKSYHTLESKLMSYHNLYIHNIIHYCEANEASQPTNKSYHTLL